MNTMMRQFSAVLIAIMFLLGLGQAVDARPKSDPAVFRFPAPPSYAKAAHVMQLARKGDVRAQAYLGYMYQTGRGVPQHYDKAAYWYAVAADNGDGNAQFALGLLYNKGHGVPQDVVLAYKWLNLSASQSEGETRDFKVRMRDAMAFKMSVAQLGTAQQLARDWYRGARLR